MRIDFGKHRGLTFGECRRDHPDYCEWLLKQPENSRTVQFREFIEKHASLSRAPVPPPETGGWGASGRSGGSSTGQGQRNVSGRSETIDFGKHRGKSFEEICQTDVQYCQWAVKFARKPDAFPSMRAFAAFVEEHFPEIVVSSSAGSATPPGSPSSEAAVTTARKQRQEEDTQWRKPTDSVGRGFTGTQSWKSYGNKTDNQRAWTPKSIHNETLASLASGKRALDGGEFRDMTYADVFEQHPQYCKWVVEWGVTQCAQRSGWQWPFIAYVQHRWLMGDLQPPPETFRITAKRHCLEGASFAITALPGEMRRHVLEELIGFFKGKVVSAVTSNTTYLIVGKKYIDGQAVEAGSTEKRAKARQHDIPLLTVAELLDDLRATSEDGEQETFVSGNHAEGEEHGDAE